jgi:ubiquinone/menaquinone biosynthesis C-methylase UbiE
MHHRHALHDHFVSLSLVTQAAPTEGVRPPEHRLFAAVYDRAICALEQGILGAHRSNLLGGLDGLVLDVGAGTGVNLAYLGQAARVVAAEPDPWMRRRLAANAASASVPVEVRGDTAEALGFDDASFDAVVCTCVLCSVTDLDASLSEVRRVLRPSGRLVILEHVRGDGRLAAWQDRLVPLWSRVVAGCHPNRDVATAVERAGLNFESKETFDPMPSWVPARPWLKAIAFRR